MTIVPEAKEEPSSAPARRGQGKASPGRARSLARRSAVQAIYQWQVAGQDVNQIEAQFVTEQDMKKVDVAYFSELLHEVPAHLAELDDQFASFLDRPIPELDPVERAILRIGAYELKCRPDIPYRVIINEAVELAKTFGAEQSHKYVNSILDKVARKLRAVEMQVKPNQSAG
ncbi:MAG: transcription antitermination factor NusB [Gammaproteobacteria bacterium]|nr:transcription antitermination factor NusB [Gammaproteobacteria bacterium]